MELDESVPNDIVSRGYDYIFVIGTAVIALIAWGVLWWVSK